MSSLNNMEPFPKIGKKFYIAVWAIVTAVLLGIIAWNFGVKKWEAEIYSKGVNAGMIQVNTAIIQQLVAQGRIGVNIPFNSEGAYDPNGTIRTIILTPMAQ